MNDAVTFVRQRVSVSAGGAMTQQMLAGIRTIRYARDHPTAFLISACALIALAGCSTLAEDDEITPAVSSNAEALTAATAPKVSCKGGRPCDDGLACTKDDRCVDGVCKGTLYSCNDNNVCTADSCDGRGGCTFVPVSGSCNDGNACTFNDSCSRGACVGTPYSCDDGNSCTADSCDGAGGCTHAPISGSCNDGNSCTTNDTCVAGVCRGTVPAEICDNGIDDDCDGLIDQADPDCAPPGPPKAPSSANARPANSSTVDLSWTDNSSNESGFRVERSTDGGSSYWTVWSTGPNATSFRDTGRSSEYTVCYRIVAFNDLGESPISNMDCTTPPAAPTSLTAAKTDPQTILLAWKDNSAHEDAYEVQRSTALGGPFVTVATVFPGAYFNYGIATYRDAAATGSIKYWYRVRATKEDGFSDFSNTAATSDPAAPIAPSGISAAPFLRMMDVIWFDNSTNEEGFRLERSTDGGTSWVTALTTGVNSQGAAESWFVEEQQICYRVFAFNGFGESPPSNTDCTVLPAAPGLGATAADHQTIELSWSDNSNFEDAYEVQRADWECSGGEFYGIAVLPANATSYRDALPPCGTEYIYQVRALKGRGYSAFSNQAYVSTPPPPLGSVEVTTATTGVELDADGYTVSVDDGPGNAIAPDGIVTFTVPVGDHRVALGGIASNCAVDGANPRIATVVKGLATRLYFSITCFPGGTLQVTTVTAGVDPDPNGFTVSVDDAPAVPIATSGTTTVSSLLPGNHQVRLAGIATNCDVTSSNPRGFGVVAGETTQVTFETTCAPVTKLAFVNGGIYSINSNGTGATLLTPSGGEPAWSPDGTKIAFANGKIHLMNADGSNPVRLTSTPLYELHPTWSRDGSRIAFCGTPDTGGSDIYVMNVDGTSVVRLTDSGGEVEPAWSPDGSKIAFRSVRNSGFSDIYVMNPDGTGVTQLTNNTYVHDFDPAWSPDGTKIAFTSGYSPNYDIHIMNADGTNLVRITSGGASEPTWSPDGRKIAFLKYDGDVWVVRVDGTDPAPLTAGSNPAWRR